MPRLEQALAGRAPTLTVQLTVGADEREDHDFFAVAAVEYSQISVCIHAPVASKCAPERMHAKAHVRLTENKDQTQPARAPTFAPRSAAGGRPAARCVQPL
jgi:hypothetical protein